jgi:NAD(P)-dependent dehydrogenase (short-subunit alcohol dehydrogenase family)
MPTQDLTGTTALVTGASRGFGRGVAVALAEAGARVVAVARDAALLADLQAQLGDKVTTVAADVTDPVVAGRLVEAHRPRTLVLNAGANPLARPLQEQSWESFSRPFDVDVRQVFNWTREALLRPLDPGSTVISFSSGAALRGSPMSGGYAGAKATIRFISAYAASEAERAALDIRFVALLPQMSPLTDIGANGAAAYAARQGLDLKAYVESMGPLLTPEQVGKTVVELAADAGLNQPAYLLTAGGVNPVG